MRRLCSRRAAALLFGVALLAGNVAAESPLTVQAGPARVTQATSPQLPLTVASRPVVYAVDPNSGPTLGGTRVTIYGVGFTSATAVKFGSVTTSCSGFSGFFVISDTQITVTTPSGALGTVDVVVVGPGGSSQTGVQDRFTYANPTVPVVSGISPNSGPTAGGTFVEIHGTGFTNATRTFFGATQSFAFAPTDTVLFTNSPPEAAGTVHVTVLTPSGTSATTNADKFTFTAPGTPVVHAVAPNSATAAGGTGVVILGSGFSGATAVHFGTTALGPGAISVNDDDHIFVTAPPGTPGTVVHVTVTTAIGTSVATNADTFSYLAPTAPVVNGVLFSHGPTFGGTQVELIGSGFSGATAVKFGVNAATTINVFADGNLSVTSPPGAVGTVDITVTTPVGTSTISAADRFTYVTAPRPVVYGIAPNSGILAGQSFVSIFGSGFTGTTSVHFGTNAANNLRVFGDSEIDVSAPPGVAGTVDVTVTTPGGVSAANTGDKYTYKAAGPPVVNSVSPNHGAPAGGDFVELFGSGFTGATAVHFGTVAATFFSVFTDTQLSVQSPPGTNGTTVDVTVTTPVGTSTVSTADHFAYVTPPIPVVTAISPSSGPTSGGTTVWISGTALSGVSTVLFGTTTAFFFEQVSDNVIEVHGSPAGALGTVNVTVTTGGGTSGMTTADQFTYTAPPQPAIATVSPSTGPASGGSTVYVSGSGFEGATAVNFGAAAGGFFVNDDHLITATSPAGSAGMVNVTVVGPGGTSPMTTNDQFTYTASSPPPAPVVTSVSPSSGSTVGGSTVYVTGTNFTNASAVNFGTNPAGFFVDNDNLITVFGTPSVTAGLVNVTVVTPSGTSAITSSDQYTFVTPAVPTITGISPATGPLAGGTTVWITGTGLNGASAVSFGLNSAGFSVVSSNLIVSTSPAGSTTVDVKVTTPGGTSATSTNDQFVYGGPAPSGLQVNGVSPNLGPAAGGTNVEIDGLGFTGATAVKFGTTPASFFFLNGDTQIFATSPAGTVTTVDVTVTVGGSTSTATKADHFTFTAPVKPVVNAIDPNHGSSAGQTGVTIFGSGFSGTTGVQFGSSPAAFFFVSGDTQIFANSPAGPAGTSVHVTVTNSAGTSTTSSADSFTFITPAAPVVNAVDPSSGTSLGGTSVTIYGSGLSGAISVFFGSTLTFASFSGSDSQITVFSPAGAVGPVDVTVTTPGGTSAISNASRFTYVAPGTPVINAVSPNRGGTAGGRMVRVFGTGLSGATAVHFGTAAATDIAPVSDGEVDVTSPPGAGGTIHVTVTTPGGISVAGPADQYTYFVAGPPSVTAVSPNSGPAGTEVFITGTGFSDATSVFFGSVCVQGFSTFFGGTDTSLQVFAPPGPTGTVDITVTSPDGTSAVNVNDRFTYTAPPVPTVTYVAPATGPSSGKTMVFITGTGLAGVTGVTFGSAPASFFFAFDDGLIQAGSPAGTNGTTVDVRVTTPGGTSAISGADHYTYGPTPVPSVTAVSPNTGSSGGGTNVFVTGTGFLAATQMKFGTTVLTPCFAFGFGGFTPVQVGSSPTILTRQSPSLRVPIATQVPIHDPRLVQTSEPRFATVLIPSVAHQWLTGLASQPAPTRTSAPLQRGGPPPCVSGFVTLTDNLIEAFSSPPQGTNPATVDVTVTNAGGTSAVSTADHFTYVVPPAPVVSAVSPSSGPSGGGTTVFVSGSNLRNATAVKFGVAIASIQSDPFLFFFGGTSGSLIEVFSPPGTNPSTVDVTVTTAGGTSATSPSDRFTYGPTPTPSVSAVSPNTGPIGTDVFITGTGFLGATAVDFDTAPASALNIISDTLIHVTSPTHSLGTAQVTVVTAGGTSPTGAADQYTYTASPTPTVSAVSPNLGLAGTVVYVTGSGLTGASGVTFGGTTATFKLISDTLIRATSPAGSGTVDVKVTTPGGTSTTSGADRYTYGVPPSAPTVTSVVPNTGPAAGGTSVTITGTNLAGATAVSFGGTAATSFTLNSATQITATSPAGSGVVDVTVTTAGGLSAISAGDEFTYVASPTVTSVVPNTGPAAGGTVVTITGTNFTGATVVKFGNGAAATFTVNSATQITATSPAGSGVVDVTVTTAGGTSATSGADQFTYARPVAQSSPVPTPTPRPTAQSSPIPSPSSRP